MTDERTRRVQAVLDDLGADWAVLVTQDAVAYALQHPAVVEAGPQPWDGGPTVGVVGRDGATGIACQQLEGPLAEASAAEVVVTYESLGFADQRPKAEKYATAVVELLERLGVGGTVAVEEHVLPVAVAVALEDRGARPVGVSPALDRTRAVKTAEEVDLLRRVAHVTAAGHEVVRRGGFAGRTELDLFHDVRAAMEHAAQQRCAVTGDLVTGRERTAAVGGWAVEREIRPGDAVIADLAPRVDGYWGDSCSTHVVGEPTRELADLYALVRRAYERVLETLRPGVVAGAFDASIRSMITDAGFANPVHLGHSIGTSVHEWPRVIPDADAVLQPGMVLLMEPGGYREDVGGVRLEQMFLLTDDGHEVLSPWTVPDELPEVAA